MEPVLAKCNCFYDTFYAERIERGIGSRESIGQHPSNTRIIELEKKMKIDDGVRSNDIRSRTGKKEVRHARSRFPIFNPTFLHGSEHDTCGAH